MTWYKRLLIQTRWGGQLTPEDYFLAADMTFMEIWKSSFLCPKTARVRTAKRLLRR